MSVIYHMTNPVKFIYLVNPNYMQVKYADYEIDRKSKGMSWGSVNNAWF